MNEAYPKVQRDPEHIQNPITRARVRYLLENHKFIRGNIWEKRNIIIEMETATDIIEARCLGAMDYAVDRVQTSGEAKIMTMSSIKREQWIQRKDVSTRNSILDAEEAELDHLLDVVFSLPPIAQAVIICRFYKELNVVQTQEELKKDPYKAHYVDRTIKRITKDAIRQIVEIFNARRYECLEN